MTWLASKVCDAALQQTLVEGEDELFAVAGGQRDAGALVEVVEVEGLGTQTRGAGFELGALLLQSAATRCSSTRSCACRSTYATRP